MGVSFFSHTLTRTDTASAQIHTYIAAAARQYARTVHAIPHRSPTDVTNAYEDAVTQRWDDQGCHLDAVVHAVAALIEDGRGDAIFGGDPTHTTHFGQVFLDHHRNIHTHENLPTSQAFRRFLNGTVCRGTGAAGQLHNIGEYLALLFGRHPGSMNALARVSRAEAYTHTVKWIGTCEACERHRDPERHRTQPRTSFIELTTTETRASEALNRNATRRHLIRRCPRGDTGTAADWAATSHGPPVLAFHIPHIPHTTTEQIELEPDLNYLGHRYALRALILAQPRHFVTISRRWCGRPRRPVWLYQDSMHDPEPVLTAIARRQDQRGATRTATDPTMQDFQTLCSLVGDAFRGLLYTLEGPLPPSPPPDATEDSPHVPESSTPDDPGPSADHPHLGPAAPTTADPTLATNPRKRPPPTDMTERRGAQRGKLIPGVDVLNATWLTSPPQAVLDAPRTTGASVLVGGVV